MIVKSLLIPLIFIYRPVAFLTEIDYIATRFKSSIYFQESPGISKPESKDILNGRSQEEPKVKFSLEYSAVTDWAI